MGSNLEALTAGMYPEATLTNRQTITPEKIHSQGITKGLLIINAVRLPTATPKIIPKRPPN